jgi:transcriptional regulator with XRE-family HTH domain
MARETGGERLGARLKAAAKKAGKSAEQIAREMTAAGEPINVISVRRWWAIGKGTKSERMPMAHHLRAYAQAVGLTVEELYGDGEAQNRAFSERILQLADALMSGKRASAAVEEVTEPGYLSQEQRARLDLATDLFRMALQQALPQGVEWRHATAEQRRRAIRLLESLLDRPPERDPGDTSRQWQ